MKRHALLSASAAHRWLNCPPSARLTENMPDETSSFAEEGTLAHSIAEVMLKQRLQVNDSKARQQLDSQLTELKQHDLYLAEMDGYLETYVALIEEMFLNHPKAEIYFEKKVTFKRFVPEGFGTCDVVIVADGTINIIDLKYGKGVPVSAINNPQMRLYALGAIDEYDWLYDIKQVTTTIIQPRLDSVSLEELTRDAINDWAENTLVPTAVLAYNGEGEYKSGDWCTFCKARGDCRARTDANLALLALGLDVPPRLNNEELAQTLFLLPELKSWASDVEEYALKQALAGQEYPGWKIVEGRSRRKIVNEDAAMEALKVANIAPEKCIKMSLFGITELEKNLGKGILVKLIGKHIEKPPGKPTLVPEDDKRPVFNSANKDFEGVDFNE